MKPRTWITAFFITAALLLAAAAAMVIVIDPFFHYHAPDTDSWYYTLDNQRSQNDGISRNFSYDALITGTSMADNFRTSELDELFDVNSVKVTYDGGTLAETGDNLRRALKADPELKLVIRSLDESMFFDSSEDVREELGTFPDYLYDDNIFNDVKYILNRDVLFGRVLPMIRNRLAGEKTGITSFDDYSRWQDDYEFGIHAVDWHEDPGIEPADVPLTEEEREVIYENITKNVTDIADEYPNTLFYVFIPPYSVSWWNDLHMTGMLNRQIEAERYIIELLLEHPNIRLYSFNDRTEITADLNNYKDAAHYGEWVNSQILRWMKEGTGQLTRENYEAYIAGEKALYTDFDYASVPGQEDYEDDALAASNFAGDR